MGKIPPIVTIVIGIVLLVGLSAAFFFLMIKPKAKELADAQAQYETDKAKADTLPQVKAQYQAAVADWMKARMDLEQLMALRSTPISFYTPIPAWIALWQEYRVTMPGVIEKFVKSFGLRIVSGMSMPAPPASPPSPPASGYMAIPEGTVTLTVEGTLQQLERFYRSIKYCPRVMTIGGLSLSGTGNTLTATVPMNFYLLVETPPGAAAAAGGPGGAPPGVPGAPGGAPPPGAPGARPAGGGGGGEGGGEEAAGPKIGAKGGDGGE